MAFCLVVVGKVIHLSITGNPRLEIRKVVFIMERISETERIFELSLKKQELQDGIIKTIGETIKNYKDLPLDERTSFVSTIPYNISALQKEVQKTVIDELSISGILIRRDLQKRVNEINDLFKKEEAPEEKKQKKTCTKTLIPGLIHLIKEDGKAGYLLQREGRFYIEEIFTGENGIIYKPKSDLPIYYCGVDILEESREVNYSFLLKDIIKYIKKYLELPEGKGYLILALWVFHTYIIEKFETTPILYFKGVKETGKTRAGEVLGELAYKCERLTSPTEATLFRSAEYFQTALIIDELQLWGKEGNQEVARLIKTRYKRGLKVSRINLNKSGEDQVEYFDVFGPLAISTTESIPDIIESRCISFLMQKNKESEVERFIDKESARIIRNKLTVFRANFMERKLGEVKPISRRRLNEILNPLYQILMEIDPDQENEFKLLAKSLEQAKDIEEEFTIEAEIVEAVMEYYKETKEMAFLTSEIVRRLNEDKKSVKDEFSSGFIGRRLGNLGFKRKRLINGKRGFNFELGFLEKLIAQYNIKNIEPPGNLLTVNL